MSEESKRVRLVDPDASITIENNAPKRVTLEADQFLVSDVAEKFSAVSSAKDVLRNRIKVKKQDRENAVKFITETKNRNNELALQIELLNGEIEENNRRIAATDAIRRGISAEIAELENAEQE